MTLPARLLWGVKLHENVLHVINFDCCFGKSWYRKLSFSYRNNHNSIAVTQYAFCVGKRNGACACTYEKILNNVYILQSRSVS